MSPTDGLTLAHCTNAKTAKLMDELRVVYADAYGAVPGEDTREKVQRLPGPGDSSTARGQLLACDGACRWPDYAPWS